LDTAVLTALTGSGVAGIVIVLLITKVLVLGWEYRKLEKENDSLRVSSKNDQETARTAVSQLAMANQLIGELKQIARYRAGGAAVLPAALPGPGDPGAESGQPARLLAEEN